MSKLLSFAFAELRLGMLNRILNWRVIIPLYHLHSSDETHTRKKRHISVATELWVDKRR